MSKSKFSIYVFILIVVFSSACKFEAKVGYNSDDLQQAQTIAEKYFENLKKQQYDVALTLTTNRLQSLIQAESLKADLEGQFGGEAIQSWSLKSHKLVEGPPRLIYLLYQVQSPKVSREVEITTELVPNPFQWKIASVKSVNDQTAVANAKQGSVIADQFFQHLKAHDYAAGYQLSSALFQRTTSKENLEELWSQVEKDIGTVNTWSLRGYNDTTADFTGTRQPYTTLIFEIEGSKGHIGAGFTMQAEANGWKIEGVQFRDISAFK